MSVNRENTHSFDRLDMDGPATRISINKKDTNLTLNDKQRKFAVMLAMSYQCFFQKKEYVKSN